MNKKITLLLTCMLFAFNTVFSQNANQYTLADNGTGTYTVTLGDGEPAGYLPEFFDGTTAYVQGGVTFTLNGDGTMTMSNVPIGVAATSAVAYAYQNSASPFDFIQDNGFNAVYSVALITGDSTAPVITLNTPGTQTIEVGTAYSELGASATDNIDAANTLNVVIDATNVNTAVVGSYSVTYNVSDASGNPATQVTRAVEVVDTTDPVITLNTPGTQTIEVGVAYSELGATASDNHYGAISPVVIDASAVNTSVVGAYSVTYNIDDVNGRSAAEVTRAVEVVDTTIPVITLLGDNPQNVEVGAPFVFQFATATDNYDDDAALTATITHSQNMSAVLGSYYTDFSVTDSQGNAAVVVRRVMNRVDTTDPTAIAIAGPIEINLNGVTSITPQDVDNGSTDNNIYDALILSLDKSSFTCADLGANTVTLTVTDVSNNSATATVVVNVIDDVIPMNVALVNPTYVHPTGTPYVEQGFTQDEVCVNGYTIVSSDLDVNQWGTYTIVYKVLDMSGNESAEITRTQVVNNVPATDAANYTVNQDTEDHVFDVLIGDSFGPDGPESFTISGPMSVQNGTLILNDNGTTDPTDDSVIYSPFATYNGPDSFSYTLEDENGDTATRTVNITVRPIVPVPVDDIVSFDKNSTNNIISVLGNDDFGGNEAHAQWPLTFTNGSKISASTEGGSISIEDNGTAADLTDDVIFYSPPANYVGADSFMYTITDSDGDATSATVTITVVEGANGNSTPTAMADTASVHEGSTLNVIDVLDNDSPGTDGYIDNGLTLINGTSLGASANGGIINVDNKGTATTTDDEFLYSAPAGFTGTDTFMYTITDSSGDASTATVTVTVNTVTNVPVAMDDTLAVLENSGATSIDVTDNDSFGTDGAAPIPFIINSPDHITGTTVNGGTFALNENGTVGDPSDDEVFYTPAANFVGTDSFQYTIRDINFDESIGTVTVTVGPVVIVNGTPTALSDAVTVAQNSSSYVINVLDDNGSGADSFGTDGASLTHPLTFPNGSTTSASANGGGITVAGNTIEYSPAAGFAGADSFDYVITDSTGDAATATVTITVTGSAQVSVPTAQDDAVSVAYNSTNNVINVLAANGGTADDFGSDGAIDNGLTMTNGTLISASTNGGAISIDNKGTNDTLDDEFNYDAPTGFSGTDTFMYTITDASGDASSATVTVTVAALVMDAPTAVDDTFAVLEDSTNNDLAILSNGDSFGDDGAGSITLSVTTAGGTVVINDNALIGDPTDDTVTYTPLASFVGTDTFTYTLEDSNGDLAIATVTITVGTVIAPATTPTAVDDNVSVVRFSISNYIDVMANDNFGADGKSATHPLTLSNGRLTGTSTGGRFIQVHDSGTPLDFSDDTVSYSPGSLVTDSFEYTITDASGDATTGIVNITTTALKSQNSIRVGSNEVFENNFLAYPNPSKGNLKTTLLSSISTKATVFLSDVTGKVIYKSSIDLKAGTNQLEFNFNVNSGIMLLKIISAEVDFGTSKVVFK